MKQEKVKNGLAIINYVNYAAYVLKGSIFVLLLDGDQQLFPALYIAAIIFNQAFLTYVV
jgi:hypothetical protein